MLKNGEYIKSPLNYTGGKYKLLGDIIPRVPCDIKTFVDLFSGGFNVGINVIADKIICNDSNNFIIDMFSYFKSVEPQTLIGQIKDKIETFNLSLENKTGYLKLREEYNREKTPLNLFVLTCYSFNHLIRFNGNHDFNTPFGFQRSQYNMTIERNLIQFCRTLKEKNTEFTSFDFEDFPVNSLSSDDFVYLDPPYLISNAVYNDGKRGFKNWNEEQEKKLIKMMELLDKKNIRFMLSNVLKHKGTENTLLIDFCKSFRVIPINKTYNNCSYQKRHRQSVTEEVLILNY